MQRIALSMLVLLAGALLFVRVADGSSTTVTTMRGGFAITSRRASRPTVPPSTDRYWVNSTTGHTMHTSPTNVDVDIEAGGGGGGGSTTLQGAYDATTASGGYKTIAFDVSDTPIRFTSNGGVPLATISTGGLALQSIQLGADGLGATVAGHELVSLVNTTTGIVGTPVQQSPDIFLGGQVYNATTSKEIGWDIVASSATSGASYTTDLYFFPDRDGTFGGAALQLGYDGTSKYVLASTIGTDASNQHHFPADTSDLVSANVLNAAAAAILSGANTWSGVQSYQAGDLAIFNAGNTQKTTLATLATAARTWTFPDVTDTACGLGAVQTITGAKTFNSGDLKVNNSGNTFATTLASSATAARTWTFPDVTDTACGLGLAQTFTAAKTFSSGTLQFQNAANTQSATLATLASTSRTYTFPDVTDTVVLRDATQTLTQKTISGGTLSNNTMSGSFSIAGISMGSAGSEGGAILMKEYGSARVSIANAASITVNSSNGELQVINLGATAITAISVNGGYNGELLEIEIKEDGTGGRSISGWPASVVFGDTFAFSTSANAVDRYQLVYDNTASKWYEVARIVADSLPVSANSTQTLANKTLSSPTVSGTVAGTYSVGGTPTLASNLVTNGFVGPNYGGTSTNVSAPSYTTPSLLNSWVNYGAPYTTAGYFKNALGEVVLKGVVKNGTSGSANIMTLPAGFRPSETWELTTYSAGNAVVCIDSSGNVNACAGGSTGGVVLDGLRFPAQQ